MVVVIALAAILQAPAVYAVMEPTSVLARLSWGWNVSAIE